jgi:hypothetical protein
MSGVYPVGAVPCRHGFYPVVRSRLSACLGVDHRCYPVPPSVLCPTLILPTSIRLSGLSTAMSGVYPVGAVPCLHGFYPMPIGAVPHPALPTSIRWIRPEYCDVRRLCARCLGRAQ